MDSETKARFPDTDGRAAARAARIVEYVQDAANGFRIARSHDASHPDYAKSYASATYRDRTVAYDGGHAAYDAAFAEGYDSYMAAADNEKAAICAVNRAAKRASDHASVWYANDTHLNTYTRARATDAAFAAAYIAAKQGAKRDAIIAAAMQAFASSSIHAETAATEARLKDGAFANARIATSPAAHSREGGFFRRILKRLLGTF